MNLSAVMEEIADKLGKFTGINIFDYPTDSISTPAGIISYPESIDYDQTYGRGEDIFRSLPVYMVTDRADSKSARIQAGKWTNPVGNESVKKYLDNASYNSCDDIQVVNATFDIVTIAGIDYLAVVFILDVTGEGE